MAINISGYPTKPDIANADVVYTVTSSLYTNPQYQYVCDIKDNSGTLIQRLKQQPNPNGEGVFNIGQILSSQAFSNVDAINITPSGSATNQKLFSATTGSFGRYNINFGEEYGTSVSSSVTLYNGAGSAGAPSVNKGDSFFIVGGTKDWNTLPNRFSWFSGSGVDNDFQQAPDYKDSGSLTITDPITGAFRDTRHFLCYDYLPQGAGGVNVFYNNNNRTLLTEYPVSTTVQSGSRVYNIRENDALTVSFLNGNFDNSADNESAQDIAGFYITPTSGKVYWVANSSLYGGGPRAASSAGCWSSPGDMAWFNVYGDQNQNTRLITMNLNKATLHGMPAYDLSAGGAGNVSLAGSTYAKIQLTSYTRSTYTADGNLGTFWVYWDNNCNYYDVVRFAWKNTFGVYDWYSANLVSTANTDVSRQQYTQTNVNYSANNVSVFDAQRRGKTQFYNGLNRKNTVTTDWLNEEMALYMRELFFSTDVLVQDYVNNRMLPVVITNANVVEKTNPKGQKLFNYTIEFEFANNLTARR